MRPESRNGGPVLMLSEQTQKLLVDVFGKKLVFRDSIPVRRRFVLWGKGSQVAVLPHSGLVMAESALLAELWALTSNGRDYKSSRAGLSDWQILSSGKGPRSHVHRFGTRVARASGVRLKAGVPEDACWTESLEAGWLFLVPCGKGRGSLVSVGGSPAELMEGSRLISDQIEAIEDSKGEFAAYPRINTPLCEDGWISCGTAAVGFDPICGEGVGNAVREAILASAVIAGTEKGLDPGELLALYSSRLMNGFSRHLKLCLDFYRSACQSDWWQVELSCLEEGLAWAHQQLSGVEQPKYCLAGFELQQVG